MKMAVVEVNKKPKKVFLFKDSFFDINGKEINISGAEWQSYYNNMNMRLPDGKKADAGSKTQKIIFNADIQGKLADKLKLTGLELKPDVGSVNGYEYNGQRLIYEAFYMS